MIATASPRNHDLLKRLGVREAFDYRSRTAVVDIARALRGREIAGALAIGEGAGAACVDIVGVCKGNCFVVLAAPPASLDDPPAGRGRWLRLVPAVARMAAASA